MHVCSKHKSDVSHTQNTFHIKIYLMGKELVNIIQILKCPSVGLSVCLLAKSHKLIRCSTNFFSINKFTLVWSYVSVAKSCALEFHDTLLPLFGAVRYVHSWNPRASVLPHDSGGTCPQSLYPRAKSLTNTDLSHVVRLNPTVQEFTLLCWHECLVEKTRC